MPWIVGVDEAGYGPNLGPFVMTAVACRVPAESLAANLWKLLARSVRRHGDEADERILIDDSKLVYSTTEGLGALEAGVLATIGNGHLDRGVDLDGYVADFAARSHDELKQEVWYLGTTPLPASADRDRCRQIRDHFCQACEHGKLQWGTVRSIVVCAERFNELVERWGTKGTVLGHCLGELLAAIPADEDEVHYFIDKHGGRNYYAAMLQQAIPDGMVVACQESSLRSRYQVLGLGRSVHFTFEPRADASHFCVALASMASKYLRELLMLEFNRFWQEKVPGLKATAGYPGDASRFFRAIRPAVNRLGLAERTLWRQK